MTFKVLIAEDARDVAEVVAFAVRMTWPDSQVTLAPDGQTTLDRFMAEPADLVVLDISMPPPNGFDVCRHIRAVSQVPILMLTVHDAMLDKVRAFDLGADDYLTKPFDHLELLARLRALVRRSTHPYILPTLYFTQGDLSIDFLKHELRLGGELVRLTTIEYRLLVELVRHAGQVVSHQFLMEQVWGANYRGDTHYLKVLIRRLRQKLGDTADEPRYIFTEWGTGYRFIAGS